MLASAAQELADPNKKKDSKKQLIQVQQERGTKTVPNQDGEDWRAVVQQRIDAKTRRFASSSAKAAEATSNKFAPVAGHFIFPLLHQYDK